MNLLLFFTLSIIWMCVDGLTHWNQPIQTNAGIYYEPLHQVRFTRADWKLVTAINLASLKGLQGELNINETINRAYRECNIQHQQFNCASALTVRTLLHKQTQISVLINQINDILSYTQLSSKRSAPFGFIGSLSKTLFGTLNSDDAEYFNQEIDKLYYDQKKLTQVLANETHIVKSTLHSLQETMLKEIHRNREVEATIQKALDVFKTSYNETVKKAYFQSLKLFSNQMHLTLDSYLNTLETVIDAILFAKVGIIHPELIAPKRMEHAIKTFIEHQRNYVFPIPIEEIHNGELEKISKISIAHHDDKIILVIQVPLLEPTIYHFYQLHPYPTPQQLGNNSGSAYIQPRANYLILSKEQERYSLIPDINQPFCLQTQHHYICKPSYPLYDFVMQPICEVSLLGKTVQNPHEDCDIRVSKVFNPYWRQLTKSKGWLYSLPQEESIQMICGENNVKNSKINGTGIMYINPGCIAKSSYSIMLGYEVFKDTIELELEYVPIISLNISKLVPEINNYENLLSHVKLNEPPRIKSFANMPGSLSYDATLSEIEQELLEISTHHRQEANFNNNQFYNILIFILIVVAFLLYIFRKVIKLCCSKIFKSNRQDRREIPENSITRGSSEMTSVVSKNRKKVEFKSLPNEEEIEPEPSTSQLMESQV